MGTPIVTSSSTSLIVKIEDIATGPLQTRPVVLEHDGKPAILYSTKSDRVAFQLGDKRSLIDETARVKMAPVISNYTKKMTICMPYGGRMKAEKMLISLRHLTEELVFYRLAW